MAIVFLGLKVCRRIKKILRAFVLNLLQMASAWPNVDLYVQSSGFKPWHCKMEKKKASSITACLLNWDLFLGLHWGSAKLWEQKGLAVVLLGPPEVIISRCSGL